jgi:hypothetical protein
MPRITNPKGIAMINRGFINSLLFRLLIACGYWKREGGRTGNTLAEKTGAEVHATVCVSGPAFYLLRAITALEDAIK